MKKHTQPSFTNLFFNAVFYLGVLIVICIILAPYAEFYAARKKWIPFSERLNYQDIKLEKGKTVRIYPLKYYKTVKYSSSDFKVAEVNKIGRVKAKRKGTAIIQVDIGDKVLKCRIKVVDS